MSCLTTSATRRSRRVPAAVLIASAAASSHDVLLVPMISVTLYTLMTISFRRLPAARPDTRSTSGLGCLGQAALLYRQARAWHLAHATSRVSALQRRPRAAQ